MRMQMAWRRQYFFKKMKLNTVSRREVASAVDKLNSGARKCLNYQKPYEAFRALTDVDVKIVKGYALIT